MEKENKSTNASLRQKAEEFLKNKKPIASALKSWLTEPEALRIVHELEVHQIELEMQNEELQLAMEQAEVAATKYSDLYDFAPSGYFTLAPNTEIIGLNLRGSQMLGKERAHLINRPFTFFIPDDTIAVFNLFFRKVFETKTTQVCEIKLTPNGNAPIFVHLTGIITENGQQCLITASDITENKLAEMHLKESELRFKNLFEHHNAVMLLIEPESGRIIDANHAAANFYGYSIPVLKKMSISEINTLSADEVKTELLKAFHEKRNYFIFPHRKANGEDCIVEVHSSPVSFKGERILFSIIHDITERIKAEKALAVSEHSYREIFDASNDALFVQDIETGSLLDANQTALKMYGYSNKQELLKCTIEDLSAAEKGYNQAKIIESNQKAIESGLNSFEWLARKKNGDEFWAQVSLHKTQIGGQDRILASVHDITDRKSAEEALIASENHSRALINALPDMMFMLDSDGVYLDYKAAKGELYYQPETIIGKRNRDITPPEFADMVDEKIKLTLETGQIQVFEYQLPVPSNEMASFEARMVPGGPNKVIAIVRDVTDQKRKEAEILQINQQLKESNSQKDKFFSIIAHDLKSPFNSIMGFSELLVEQTREKNYDGIEKFAGIILQSSNRAMDLLMNLLEWSRSQTGRMEFNPEYFEMVDFIKDTLQIFHEIVIQKSIIINMELPRNVPVFADKPMISTIFRNLISNAIKFTKPGGLIIISATEKPDELTVKVRDNGVGISKDRIEKLFRIDESYSTPGTNNEKGTGLGLILCKEFIEKHNGKIWVESEERKGSTFYFALPQNHSGSL